MTDKTVADHLAAVTFSNVEEAVMAWALSPDSPHFWHIGRAVRHLCDRGDLTTDNIRAIEFARQRGRPPVASLGEAQERYAWHQAMVAIAPYLPMCGVLNDR